MRDFGSGCQKRQDRSNGHSRVFGTRTLGWYASCLLHCPWSTFSSGLFDHCFQPDTNARFGPCWHTTVDDDGKYTDEFSFKGDMWSLGMVLYYLCYSRLPYSQIEDIDLLRQEIRQFQTITIPEDDEPGGRVIPEELKFLIRVLLSPDKSKRPTCDEILSTLSQQRDRMVHGDMDSPTTPIRASASDIEKEEMRVDDGTSGDGSTKSEAEAFTNTATSLSSSSQLAAAASNSDAHRHNLQSHRPIYHPIPIGRRASRPTLVSERGTSGPTSNHHFSSPLTSSPYPAGARNTASPTVNLHKKVKPLGIGLRHMLRRKTMHHPLTISGSGMGLQRYSRSGDSGGFTELSAATLPLALRRLNVAPATSTTSPMGQNSKSLVKSSSLRMNMLPPSLSPPLALPPPQQFQHQPQPQLQLQEQEQDANGDSRPHSPPSSGAEPPVPSGGLDSSRDVSSSS